MHYLSYLSTFSTGMVPPLFFGAFAILLPLLVLWSIGWKGWALWIAARNQHRWWFVILLVVNTLGILEIIYIYAVGKPALKSAGGTSSAAQN